MSDAESTFKHDEVVRLKPRSTFYQDVGDLTGVVVGVFQSEDDGTWGYCVEFYPDFPKLERGEPCYPLEDDDLESLGAFVDPDETRIPDRLRVRVDPETGEGRAVD